MAQKAKLKCDVFSSFGEKKGERTQYGKKNEEVSLVASHDNMWIVENKKKFRYPVNVDDLIINENGFS